MKRKIMILLLVALGSFSAMAYEPADNVGLTKKEQRRTLRGYKWSVDAGMSFKRGSTVKTYWYDNIRDEKIPGSEQYYPNSNRFSLSTTHGFQFNNFFFLGGGVAFNCLTDTKDFMMPIYLAARVNILNKKVSPFVEGRMGYSFINGDIGIYLPISVGLRIALDKKQALHIAAEWNEETIEGVIYACGLGLRIGYEF